MAASILVVEDDPLARNLICWFLRKEEYEVAEAGDGAEALELLKARRFDLVISDFVMPKLDGLKLVEHLHAVSPRTPVIFTTGYLSRDSGQKILQGMAAFIQKPIDFELLRDSVKRAVARVPAPGPAGEGD
jgi:two-component system chemotaxis response regulator CheY